MLEKKIKTLRWSNKEAGNCSCTVLCGCRCGLHGHKTWQWHAI